MFFAFPVCSQECNGLKYILWMVPFFNIVDRVGAYNKVKFSILIFFPEKAQRIRGIGSYPAVLFISKSERQKYGISSIAADTMAQRSLEEVIL